MPYSSRKQLPPSLRAMRPPLTPEQASAIAAQAEAIPGEGGWGIALANFKKTHVPTRNRWVQRKEENMRTKKTNENAPVTAPVPAQNLDESAPAEEAEMTEGGYYEGWVPSNVTSFAQLRAVEKVGEIAENMREVTNQFSRMIWNIVESDTAPDKVTAMQNLFAEYLGEVVNVMRGKEAPEAERPEDTEGEESPMTATVRPEKIYGEASEKQTEAAPVEQPAAVSESAPAAVENTGEVALTESDAMVAYGFEEAAAQAPMYIRAAIIKPGWGNKRDNNYYPQDVLKRDAMKFVGAKMYETDHRDDEKSTRTWVSTVQNIEGFTPEGAPIARIAVHDPGFAERLSRLNQAGLLNKMECSISALGLAEGGFELEGRMGRRVKEIREVNSVDWVTSAGAGGHARDIIQEAAAEPVKQDEAANPEKEEIKVEAPATKQEEPAKAEPVKEEPKPEPKAETPAPEKEKPAEEEKAPESPAPEKGKKSKKEDEALEDKEKESTTQPEAPKADAPAETKEAAAPEPTPEAPTFLNEAQVAEAFTAGELRQLTSGLPEVVKTRVLERGNYKDAAEVEKEVRRELAYLREVTGSGAAFGLPLEEKKQEQPMTPEKLEEMRAAVDRKYFNK